MQFSWPWGVPLDYRPPVEGEHPRITIVTPNYNGAKFIEATLRSVICQGYPNLQYIVVDGASSDESMSIIERYRDHIGHIICEPDKGHADALNKGFALADGEILAWLNSDDMYHAWSLFTVAEVFQRFSKVQWIEGAPIYWDSQGRLYGPLKERPLNQYDYLTGRYGFIQQESTFWRRELWEKAGGRMNTDYRLMIDGELWTRFFLHAQLHRLDCCVGGFRPHLTNRSHDRTLLHQEMQRAIETMRGLVSPEVRARAEKFSRVQRLTKGVPTITVREWMLRALTQPHFNDMGYEFIVPSPDGWEIVPVPFC